MIVNFPGNSISPVATIFTLFKMHLVYVLDPNPKPQDLMLCHYLLDPNLKPQDLMLCHYLLDHIKSVPLQILHLQQ